MRIAVYAGSFDPVTLGHLSVIERAAKLFDQLWVLVAINPNKIALFSAEERVQMLLEQTHPWPGVRCGQSAALVVEFAREKGALYLVRGVRGCTDIEDEIALAALNHQHAAAIEPVFVPAHPALSEISSSRLKALASEGAVISTFCTPEVEARLLTRVGVNQSRHAGDDSHV